MTDELIYELINKLIIEKSMINESIDEVINRLIND